MAEDGLLMNFDLGDGPFVQKPSFKGGRWKDRLIARKLALHRQQKLSKPTITEEEDDASNLNDGARDDSRPYGSRPVKRARQDNGEFKPSGKVSGQHAASKSKTYSKSTKPKEIVSSLFTYNPTPNKTPTKVDEAEESGEPVEPTNAPLNDELATFTSLGVSTTLASHLLNRLDLKAPTAIQKAAIGPLLTEDADAFIQAQTGSGKTLAYLLPIVQRIIKLSENKGAGGSKLDVHRDSGLFAVILAPTRELCKQISTVLDQLLRCAHWIVAGTVTGGEKKKSEKARLRKGLNILVATPGRLADHLDNTSVLDVSNVRWLVLDEGDRLMELGFEEQISEIVEKLDKRRISQLRAKSMGLPLRRITILCSATMKTSVQKLGEMSLCDAIHIKADPNDGDATTGSAENEENVFSAPAQLRQSYVIVAAKLRLVTLTAVLRRAFSRRGSVMKAIVFMSCADSVDFHFRVFTRPPTSTDDKNKLGASESATTSSSDSLTTSAPAPTLSPPNSDTISVHRLHGSLAQATRTSTLAAFAKTTTPALLICTDVASRGLDLPNIDLVIEYDPAFSAEDHLHRIGRTARAGRDGRAIIFLQPGVEEGYVDILKKGYRDGGKNVHATTADDHLKKGFGSVGIGGGDDWDERATEWQLEVERWVIADKTVGQLAKKAFQSHVRAYATHIASEREMFNIKDLHLGHLAKAFALRDRPGDVSVPGPRKSKTVKWKTVETSDGGKKRVRETDEAAAVETSADEARRKMRMKMKDVMNAAAEFNYS